MTMFPNRGETGNSARVFYGDAADAYEIGKREGAAAERDRIRRGAEAHKTDLRRPGMGHGRIEVVEVVRWSVLADLLDGDPA
ncbi:MAG TPA: hypothetical protein VF506_08960 [Streptosporangiaceae bacterium]